MRKRSNSWASSNSVRDAARRSCPRRPADIGEFFAQWTIGTEEVVEINSPADLITDRPPQIGLAGEVGVDRSLGQPGVASDRLHRRPFDAVLGKQRDRRIDDCSAGLLLLFLAAQPSSCHSQIAYTIGIANAIRLEESTDGESHSKPSIVCAWRGASPARCSVWSDNGAVTVAVSGTANLNTGLPVVREDAVPGRIDRKVVHRHGDHAARRRRGPRSR